MSNATLIEALNEVQEWELTGVIQYMQHGLLISGLWRLSYRSFFMEMSEEAHGHMQLVGDKITALGGVPSVEPKLVKQATNLRQMIEQDIELEVAALVAYQRARDAAEALGLAPQVYWLEERIADEQGHVEELQRLLREQDAAAPSVDAAASTA